MATRGELFRLRDTDDDGVADQRTQLATLETKGNYPHNGLSGLAVDATGHILVGFGENLGETYTLTGADGGQVTGGGEGGNIFRLRPDGSHIEIEDRDPEEVLSVRDRRIAPPGVGARNPAFDVTPGRLLSGLVTDRGVIRPVDTASVLALLGPRT